MAHTFISYRREDSAGYAGRLRESLERRLGDDAVFRDVDTLQPGQDFVDAIMARLRECRVFIALIGREWLDARDAAGRRRLDQPHDYVRLEIASALGRPDLLVVPVFVEGAGMPESDQLPEDIRVLGRRQAVSIRDETWDSDVDRLASVIEQADATRFGPTRPGPMPRGRFVAIGLGALAMVALLATLLTRGGRPDDSGPTGPPRWPDDAGAYAVQIPRNAEVAHGALIYTPVSGNVIPHGDRSTIRIRVRVSNRSRYDANFWDASFRLAVGDQQLAPTSGLNELVPGNSIRQGIITFEAPASARKAVLQVVQQTDIAEVPLDLSHTRAPMADEKAEVPDSLSQAIFRALLKEPRPLVSSSEINVTLVRVTLRRFVNKLRVVAAARIANNGRYPVATSVLTMRLVVEGDVLAPVDAPVIVIDSSATGSVDYVFEVPPSTPAPSSGPQCRARSSSCRWTCLSPRSRGRRGLTMWGRQASAWIGPTASRRCRPPSIRRRRA